MAELLFVISLLVLLRGPIVWYLGLASVQRDLQETREAVSRLEAELKMLRREG